MLDAFIIEEIKRRKRREQEDRPSVRLPLPQSPQPQWPEAEKGEGGRKDERLPSNGVIIIDLNRDF